MKLTVEIKENSFEYHIEVGECRDNGTMPLSLKGLSLFCDLSTHVSKNFMDDKDLEHKAFSAYAFTQAYPEIMERIERRAKQPQKGTDNEG